MKHVQLLCGLFSEITVFIFARKTKATAITKPRFSLTKKKCTCSQSHQRKKSPRYRSPNLPNLRKSTCIIIKQLSLSHGEMQIAFLTPSIPFFSTSSKHFWAFSSALCKHFRRHLIAALQELQFALPCATFHLAIVALSSVVDFFDLA